MVRWKAHLWNTLSKNKRVPSYNEIYEILARSLSYEILFFFIISFLKPSLKMTKNFKIYIIRELSLFYIKKNIIHVFEGTFFPSTLYFNTGEC